MQFLRFIIICVVGWYIGTTVVKLLTNAIKKEESLPLNHNNISTETEIK